MLENQKVYDLIGIGFGPSNLALAIAIQEESEREGGEILEALFLESKLEYAWHPGMLLKDSQMQISFLKDLVTIRNPQSKYTFINYLKTKQRLNEFVNLREFYPARIEFNDYFTWIANQLNDQVEYGKEVISVVPVVGTDNDTETVQLLKVSARDVRTGEHKEYLTRHLVVAAGGAPQVPDEIAHVSSERVFHSHEFLQKMEADFPDQDKPYRFTVIGSGQSAAEIFYHLFTTYDHADVSAVFRQFAFKPADDSSFVNEIFFPQQVDFLYSLTPEKRQKLLEAHSDTNYSVVDLDLIKLIYKSMYEEKVMGRDRIHVMPLLSLVNITDNGDRVTAHFKHVTYDESLVNLECDAVILATGYSRKTKQKLLQDLAPYLSIQESGEYNIERDYRIITKPNFEPTIYMQGYCENTHGLSDTLLSILPIRSQEIVNSLIQARKAAAKISYAI